MTLSNLAYYYARPLATFGRAYSCMASTASTYDVAAGIPDRRLMNDSARDAQFSFSCVCMCVFVRD